MENSKETQINENSSAQIALFTKKFNADPSDGIKYLIEEKIIGEDSESLASLLFQNADLDPQAIGLYLATSLSQGDPVGKAYLSQLPLNAIDVDDALRELCKRLKFPNESQMIDKILDNLAAAYIKANPTSGCDVVSVYTIFYSLLMLNTDAHNNLIPATNKMTKSQFVSLSKGTPGFEKSQLEKLYDKVIANKISV